MIEKSPSFTRRRNEECRGVGTEGGRSISYRCVQERRATTCTKTPLSMLAVASTQPFPSMSMAVTTSQAHFQSNTYPTKKARTNTWCFLHFIAIYHVSSRIFFYCKMHDFASAFRGALYRRCPLKHKDEITMEPMFFFPSCLRCKTANTFAKKNTLQIMQFLGDYSCIILL